MSADRAPVVRVVGDAALSVEFGRVLDPALCARARALGEALAERPFGGMAEVVPAYASLLVVVDPSRTTLEAASRQVVERLSSPATPSRVPRAHVIPVVYGGADGPDLEDVARASGLPSADVVRRHAAGDYTAFFVGFQPGFAYLGLVGPELETSRRATPRPRVPAGSVAIAGRQTAVYPAASPGGWNLIGRTSVRLFDPTLDPPALVRAGDHVRFEATRGPLPALERADAGRVWRAANPVVEVVDAGLLTTVQDGGRFGHRRWGVPWCGPMDPAAHARANRAVGNPAAAAALECAASGPVLRFLATVRFAVSGGDFEPVLERADLGAWPVPADAAVLARPGNVLAFRGRRAGFRCAIALQGGIDVPRVLGSAATDVINGLGGVAGRSLQPGDGLAVGHAHGVEVAVLRPAPPSRAVTVRVVPGPQADAFDAPARETLLAEEYAVSALSDRIGCRLGGAALRHAGPAEILTDGMVPGCIQVPPDGQPIVMMADCPTTGGYPKIATVVTADLPLLAQLVPGEGRVRFALEDGRRGWG